MHHKTDHPATCSQHCCEDQCFHNHLAAAAMCSSSCTQQSLQAAHPRSTGAGTCQRGNPTCIADSRPRSTGRSACQKGTQHTSQAADQSQQEEVPVRKAPNMHHRQQRKVNRKRYLSERHPTCIAGSRQRWLGRGTCQRGTQHASQAADQDQQEEAPVREAGVAVVRQLIRGSSQQGTAIAASHHRRHHSRLVAALLLQELQVQPCGHRDLIAGLV